MDIRNKKTALGDDSEIYKSRDNSFGKKDLKNLSRKQKLEYFRDYYLMRVIVIAAVLIVAGSMLNVMVFNRSNCVLALATLNRAQVAYPEELGSALEEYLKAEGKNDYVSAEAFNLQDAQMQMAFSTKVAATGMDLVICSKDFFEEGSAGGMFADLSDILPEDTYEALAERMIEGKEAETDDDGNVTGWKEARPYGLDISGSTAFAKFGGVDEAPILCVMGNAAHLENVQKAIAFFAEF